MAVRSNTFDPFMDISLEVNQASSLEKALDAFTKSCLDGLGWLRLFIEANTSGGPTNTSARSVSRRWTRPRRLGT